MPATTYRIVNGVAPESINGVEPEVVNSVAPRIAHDVAHEVVPFAPFKRLPPEIKLRILEFLCADDLVVVRLSDPVTQENGVTYRDVSKGRSSNQPNYDTDSLPPLRTWLFYDQLSDSKTFTGMTPNQKLTISRVSRMFRTDAIEMFYKNTIFEFHQCLWTMLSFLKVQRQHKRLHLLKQLRFRVPVNSFFCDWYDPAYMELNSQTAGTLLTDILEIIAQIPQLSRTRWQPHPTKPMRLILRTSADVDPELEFKDFPVRTLTPYHAPILLQLKPSFILPPGEESQYTYLDWHREDQVKPIASRKQMQIARKDPNTLVVRPRDHVVREFKKYVKQNSLAVLDEEIHDLWKILADQIEDDVQLLRYVNMERA
ncbi:hypothetical protein M501DRAFT_998608 [Patellaria atrata CBS 101060]|uniref:F-box domain-containing protein n=1 Tax=Patellaria atrata CBS 101060 TaxID=1346257 RepID=A0A9P4SIA6_9PEZI|nr:hypothetical protein M501DRAFT_998608 [Patellaria atrata CBS 101060]